MPERIDEFLQHRQGPQVDPLQPQQALLQALQPHGLLLEAQGAEPLDSRSAAPRGQPGEVEVEAQADARIRDELPRGRRPRAASP